MKQFLIGAVWVVGIGGALLWMSAPDGDQVCRMQKHPFWDALHGVDGQPTCQALIDQTEARASRAESHANELESRVEEIESRLSM